MRWLALFLTALPLLADGDIVDHPSEMRVYIERYTADRGLLFRSYPIELSPARNNRLQTFYNEWLGRLPSLGFDTMRQDAKVDYILFRNHLQHELRELDRRVKERAESAPMLPFAGAIIELEEARRRMEPVDPKRAAAAIHALDKQIADTHRSLEASLKTAAANRTVANRAGAESNELRTMLKRWFDFYNGYDPLFTWWVAEAHRRADASLQKYTAFLREKVAAVKSGAARSDSPDDIVGTPIGRDGLISELANELIPYTPEELIAIANKEFAWCEEQMKKASRELGFGDDWRKALEHVKNLYVEPGKQPALVRDLEREAEAFLEKHDLITIPPLARETWRMQMMSPERQLINPFFTGGEVVSVSYPVDSMTYEQKLMSMRGNNIHFSRATVFHELIPGHGLQAYMARRNRSYREPFTTPFTIEGWALYWEMMLWDRQFQGSPEDRVGALFWRMHRCARIVFSLRFHLGQMTPQECVGFLVDRVGHERDNAIGEVRRSFATSYSPLYQAAYLLGGLQFYALQKELVASGKMTSRQFHDTILALNRIPVELIRATLTGQKLSRDFAPSWKFYGPISATN